MKKEIAIALHGGAGTIEKSLLTPALEKAYKSGLETALNIGYEALKNGKTSTQVVMLTVESLENCPLFNAGKGAVFNHLGEHEMDAAIMDGSTLKAGAVAGVSNIKNPVKLALHIMENSPHVMMFGSGAEAFAKQEQLDFEDNSYFFTEHRHQQWIDLKGSENYQLDHASNPGLKMGTVGAVALDAFGNLAAATSTGGMTNKKYGRVGDSPIIGAGTYANNDTCAISCTGHGELFIRSVVAYDISCLIEYKGLSLKEACQIVVKDKLVKIGGEGGLIALNTKGEIEMPFNSEGMYRASVDPKRKV